MFYSDKMLGHIAGINRCHKRLISEKLIKFQLVITKCGSEKGVSVNHDQNLDHPIGDSVSDDHGHGSG